MDGFGEYLHVAMEVFADVAGRIETMCWHR